MFMTKTKTKTKLPIVHLVTSYMPFTVHATSAIATQHVPVTVF